MLLLLKHLHDILYIYNNEIIRTFILPTRLGMQFERSSVQFRMSPSSILSFITITLFRVGNAFVPEIFVFYNN